ncbi:MAG: hypothetical protein HY899_01725 [Deltaproteobacteria bacterium]|nr:hypothetical protein [Deltaproteobacteria bacterium]
MPSSRWWPLSAAGSTDPSLRATSGPITPANGFTGGNEHSTAIGVAPSGDFVVARIGYSAPADTSASVSSFKVEARSFDCRGVPFDAGDVVVNTPQDESPSSPKVAVGRGGNVLVAWTARVAGISRGRARHLRLTGGCPLCGDVSGDEGVTASDALAVLRSAVGSGPPGACTPAVCDTNDDGAISATDALPVLRWPAGHAIAMRCPR